MASKGKKQDAQSAQAALRKQLLEHVSALPHSPGVYQMSAENGDILYIGKANDLRKRVATYFREGYQHSTRTRKLVEKIAKIDFTVVNSELEALILESTQIKKIRPRYNILMKDDKSYAYLRINIHEDYPQISIVRAREKERTAGNDKARYFGPTTSGHKLKKTFQLLKKLFPFRHCALKIEHQGKGTDADNPEKVKVTNRVIDFPCMDYHLKRCPAPCIGKVSPEEYGKIIEQIIAFMEGKNETVAAALKSQMQLLAVNKKFEQAAIVRDKLAAVENVMQKKTIMDSGDEEMDVIHFALEGDKCFYHIFGVRNGRLAESETFIFDAPAATPQDAPELIEAFITQYYERASDIPHQILIPTELENSETIGEWLAQERGGSIALRIPERGKGKRLLDLCHKNAKSQATSTRVSWEKEQKQALEELIDELSMLKLKKLDRIECFDISHIQGSDTVGSMVVFEKGVPKKAHYRHFKLRTTQGKPDDFSSMKEVLSRRLKYLKLDDTSLTLKKASKKHVPFMEELGRDSGWKEFDEPAKINFKNFFILEKNKKAIGMSSLEELENGIFEITSTAIVTDERGQKLSHVLLQKVIDKIKNKKARIYGSVEPRLLTHWLEFGFTEIDTMPESFKKRHEHWEQFDGKKYIPIAFYRQKQVKADSAFSEIPDLIIVDGGKPQLSAGQEALKNLGLSVPIIALAKRLEEIFIPGAEAPILLQTDTPGLRLVQRLRDEAHRFAIEFHRKLHRKAMLD